LNGAARPVPLERWKTAGAVLLTVILWASAFAGIRAGLQAYSPQSVALLRYLTASLALGLVALAGRFPLPERRHLLWFGLAGFAGFTFYNLALNAGEMRIPAGPASLIVASAPIFVALLAALFFGERLRLAGWAGILASFLGTALISLEPRQGLQLSGGALLVLAAALSQAIYSVMQKPLLGRYPPIRFTAYAVWAGTALLLPFLPGMVRELGQAEPGATLAVVYMGIFPGALGYACWSYVLARLPATKAGSFLYLVPAAAILIAWAWLGEKPAPQAVLGGALILFGVALVNLKRWG
jgi:drug/metabolite transporter (DMT)-like permease